MKFLIVQLPPFSRHLIPLRSKYFFSEPCSQTPSVYALPLESETKFYTHTKQLVELWFSKQLLPDDNCEVCSLWGTDLIINFLGQFRLQGVKHDHFYISIIQRNCLASSLCFNFTVQTKWTFSACDYRIVPTTAISSSPLSPVLLYAAHPSSWASPFPVLLPASLTAFFSIFHVTTISVSRSALAPTPRELSSISFRMEGVGARTR
jgi:hypothetical protein